MTALCYLVIRTFDGPSCKLQQLQQIFNTLDDGRALRLFTIGQVEIFLYKLGIFANLTMVSSVHIFTEIKCSPCVKQRSDRCNLR